MGYRVLLISDRAARRHSLRRIMLELKLEVTYGPVDSNASFDGLTGFTLAVLDIPLARLEAVLPMLRQCCCASKLLALVPFEAQGIEMRLAKLGADDVLVWPITRPRLEITLRNLLRMYMLECGSHAISAL